MNHLSKRITSLATENFIFSEAQFGFRPGYSTIDAIFTLTSLIRQGKPGQKFYCAFIDFYTAFDSVNKDVLYSQLVTYGVSTKLIAMLIELYTCSILLHQEYKLTILYLIALSAETA